MADRKSTADSFAETEMASEDTLALSFLDVLSCGLGAGICLFLIFSAMPHIGQTGSGLNLQSDVLGQDAIARNVGAKFNDWDEVVRNAPIQIIVSLNYTAGPLPNPPPHITADQIQLRGLPRSSEKPLPRGLASHLRCEWHAYLNEGLRPPSQPISGFVRDEKLLAGYECLVDVSVGGSVRQVATIPLRASGDGKLRKIFDLKFTDGKWIVPAPVPK